MMKSVLHTNHIRLRSQRPASREQIRNLLDWDSTPRCLSPRVALAFHTRVATL